MPKKNKHSRKTANTFFSLPHLLLDHPDFLSMSWASQALLIHMCRFYNGYNNGDISIPLSNMIKRGWHSSTLNDAKKQLIENNWIVITRQGFKKICSLYALSWLPIDHSNKMDSTFKAFQPRSLKV